MGKMRKSQNEKTEMNKKARNIIIIFIGVMFLALGLIYFLTKTGIIPDEVAIILMILIFPLMGFYTNVIAKKYTEKSPVRYKDDKSKTIMQFLMYGFIFATFISITFITRTKPEDLSSVMPFLKTASKVMPAILAAVFCIYIYFLFFKKRELEIDKDATRAQIQQAEKWVKRSRWLGVIALIFFMLAFFGIKYFISGH